MIKLVAFDLDGTIGDTIPMCLKALKKAVTPYVTFPVFEVPGMQLIAVFRISVQVYVVARSMMLLSEMERYGRMVRTLFPDHRDPVCILCGKARYLFFPDLCCCCFSHNRCHS